MRRPLNNEYVNNSIRIHELKGGGGKRRGEEGSRGKGKASKHSHF